jgi:hypothetical protein
MTENNRSNFNVETRVQGDDVRVLVDRGGQKLGKLVLSNRTICWVPAEPKKPNEGRRMTWVMTWEQFAEVMQSRDLSEIVRLSQCTYAFASRAGARIVRQEADLDVPMPKAREKLGLRRHFNIAEFALIRKGYPPEYDESWIMYFDSIQSELRMYRALTGYCIYSLRLREDSEGGEISESWVNRESEQYGSTDIEHDAEVATWLIDAILLGRERDFPSESGSDEVSRAQQRQFWGF